MKRVLLPAIVAGSFLTAGGAEAASPATTTMGVTMTITANCTVSATGVNFGSLETIDMSSPQLDSTAGVITVTCTNGQPYTVTLGAGAGTGATFATRKMTGGNNSTSTLDYTLYTDNTRTTVWGDGTATTGTRGGTGTGDSQTYDVHGRVPAQNNVRVGTFNDTVTVTVSY